MAYSSLVFCKLRSRSSGSCGSSCSYDYIHDTYKLDLTGSGAMSDWSSKEACPWYPKRTAIKTLTLGSFTKIGNYGLYELSSITSLTLPTTLTTIGNYALYGVSGIKEFTLPKSLTTIGTYGMYGMSGLTTLTVPSAVTSIGDYGIANCAAIKSFYHLGKKAPTMTTASTVLTGCGGFTHVYGGAGYTPLTFGSKPVLAATAACLVDGTNEVYYHFDSTTGKIIIYGTGCNGNYGIHQHPWKDLGEKITSIEIAYGITRIGSNSFDMKSGFEDYYKGVKTITLPSTLTSIGVGAFTSCVSITSIDIPEKVTSIENYAFYGCEVLK